MANIQPEIDDFRNAIYGEEVRDSMVSLAEKLNEEVEEGTTNIEKYEEDIAQAISAATEGATSANAAASAASGAASNASTAATNANAARVQIEANESARQSAETLRAAAEEQRATAESLRQPAEQQRAAAEQSRAAAESSSATAEQQRSAAESERQSAEATRVSAEATRVGSENARVSAESLRNSNETERVNAETQRQRAFDQMTRQVMPPATTTTLGGIVVGDGLTVDSAGRTSVIGADDLETGTHAAATYATKAELAEKANMSHTHSASEITSGTLPIARGGTGASDAASARNGLSLYSKAEVDDALQELNDAILNAQALLEAIGTVPVANGGTGATTAAAARANLDAARSDGASGTLALAEEGIENLESSLAYVESVTAKTNHAVGDYFILGDVLMRATAAIATGETINASKATPATVQGQIDTLRDSVDKSKYQATISRIFFENTANDVAFEFQLANGRSLLLGVGEPGAYYAHKESASDSWHYYWSGH